MVILGQLYVLNLPAEFTYPSSSCGNISAEVTQIATQLSKSHWQFYETEALTHILEPSPKTISLKGGMAGDVARLESAWLVHTRPWVLSLAQYKIGPGGALYASFLFL